MRTNLRISKRQQFEAMGKFHAGIEKSKSEEQEYGPGKKSITLCKKCEAAYYKKSWHHGIEDYKNLREDNRVIFAVCPACQMIADRKFEGELILENVPGGYKEEILRNIKNTGTQAYEKDPMDRIIAIREEGGRVQVQTTENQLARNIARQIERAYKNAKVETRWSKAESIVRLRVTFTEEG